MDNKQLSMLVVDDDQDILNYFHAIFKGGPNQLYFAHNGIEALQKAKQYKIDLAFIDINMPGINGLETLTRWLEIQPATRVVIISSYSDGALVRSAIAKGAFTYLFKPLNKRDIFAVALQCLNPSGAPDTG